MSLSSDLRNAESGVPKSPFWKCKHCMVMNWPGVSTCRNCKKVKSGRGIKK